MATLRITLAAPYLNKANAAKLQKTPTNFQKGDVAATLSELIVAIAGGLRQRAPGQTHPSLTLSIDENGTNATGTLALSGAMANNDTIVIGGITLTAKTSAPSGNAQFLVGVSAAADAAAMAAIINAHPVLSTYISAVAPSSTVTLTANGLASGQLGNGVILSKTSTAVTLTAFSGGVQDSGQQTYQY